MIHRPSTGASVVALVLFMTCLAHASPAAAQIGAADTAAPAVIPRDSVAGAVEQFRQLQARLEGVQQEALAGRPELQSEQAEIQAAIENAMFAAHPDLRLSVRERIPEIEREAATARQIQDRAKLQALNDEYREIQERVQEAQSEALEQEALRNRLSDFQDTLMEAMVAVDPAIEEVYRRIQTLAGRLERTLGS